MNDEPLTVCHCSSTSSGLRHSVSTRRGVTLFELTLVLVVLVLIGALAWPALDKPFTAQRLRYAGDQVRTAWARARNQAMTSGEIWLFYYQPGGGQFYAQPASGTSAFAAPTSSVAFGADMPGSGAQSMATTCEQLPASILFAEGLTAEDPRVAGFGAGQPIASAVGAGALSWAPPVAFFPDGTATTSQLILANRDGARILVELRGMTGSSSLGDVFSDGQVTR